MSSKDLCRKLQQILHAFLANKLPKDDTMVEKLLSWLNNWLMEPGIAETFMQDTDLSDLLLHIQEQPPNSPQTLSFFLRLSSYMPQNSGNCDRIHGIIRGLYMNMISDDWTDALVCNAWLLGLENILITQASSRDWIIDKEVCDCVLSCLKHKSMFVTKAARILISSLIIAHQDVLSPATVTQPGLNTSLDKLWNNTEDQAETRLIILQILSEAIFKCPEECVHALYINYHVFDKVFSILKMSNECAARRQSIEILTLCKSCMTQETVAQLESLVFFLNKIGSMQTAMVLAHWLHENCADKITNPKGLAENEFLALRLVLTEPGHDDKLETSITDKLVRAGTFPDIFQCQLELINKTKTIPAKEAQMLLTVFQGLHKFDDSENVLFASLYKKRSKLTPSIIDAIASVFQSATGNDYYPLMCNVIIICADQLTHTQLCVTVQKSLTAIVICLVCLTTKNGSDTIQGVTDWRNSPSSTRKLVHVWSTVWTMTEQLLCQTSWETVDSAVEFITQLFLQVKDRVVLDDALDRISNRLLQLVDNSESYLRASAVTCLSVMATVPPVWTVLTAKHQQDDILDKIISATSDEEAFPRRAATKVMKSLHDLNLFSSRSQDIFNTISKATCDLDWEVKNSALEFWMAYIGRVSKCNDIIPEYALGLLNSSGPTSSMHLTKTEQLQMLVGSGCVQSVLNVAHDCDKSVQNKACVILKLLKEQFEQEPTTKKCNSEISSTSDALHLDILEELNALDIDGLLLISSLSTDQYDINPEALFDDILISVECHSSTCGEDIEDNAIDCY